MYIQCPEVLVVSPNEKRRTRIGQLLNSPKSILKPTIQFSTLDQLPGLLNPDHKFTVWGSHIAVIDMCAQEADDPTKESFSKSDLQRLTESVACTILYFLNRPEGHSLPNSPTGVLQLSFDDWDGFRADRPGLATLILTHSDPIRVRHQDIREANPQHFQASRPRSSVLPHPAPVSGK